MECSKNNICFNFPKKCEECNAISDIYNHYPCFKNKDVIEVVRCKDCKHWNCASRVTEHMGCDIFCGAYGREYPTLPEDFCSYGERRKDNELL